MGFATLLPCGGARLIDGANPEQDFEKVGTAFFDKILLLERV
jgi:hypothetical protein